MTDYPLTATVLSLFADRLTLDDICKLKQGSTLSSRRLAIAMRRTINTIGKKLKCQNELLVINRVRDKVVLQVNLKFLPYLNRPGLLAMREEMAIEEFGHLIQDAFGRRIGVFEFTERTWSVFFSAWLDTRSEGAGDHYRQRKPQGGIENVRRGHWVTTRF